MQKTKPPVGKEMSLGMPKYDPPPAVRHFDALKRILDRKEGDYVE